MQKNGFKKETTPQCPHQTSAGTQESDNLTLFQHTGRHNPYWSHHRTNSR